MSGVCLRFQQALRLEAEQSLLVEVSPSFLVPDTNALIDHLPLVQRICATKRFTVCVPVIG